VGTRTAAPADARRSSIRPCIFAHREAGLGMMALFGGFSERVFAAYHEAFPLEPGRQDRNALYQRYHVMNHLDLFGYHAETMAIVRRHV
jgi:fructosamine-3-kinase